MSTVVWVLSFRSASINSDIALIPKQAVSKCQSGGITPSNHWVFINNSIYKKSFRLFNDQVLIMRLLLSFDFVFYSIFQPFLFGTFADFSQRYIVLCQEVFTPNLSSLGVFATNEPSTTAAAFRRYLESLPRLIELGFISHQNAAFPHKFAILYGRRKTVRLCRFDKNKPAFSISGDWPCNGRRVRFCVFSNSTLLKMSGSIYFTLKFFYTRGRSGFRDFFNSKFKP